MRRGIGRGTAPGVNQGALAVTILLFAAILFLAYANGSNDNFKGVATLFGSGVSDYRRALRWATLTTLLGSAAALFLAQGLLAAFSGKGLVPASVLALPAFPVAVGLGAAVTVMLATRLGFPVSTTHALIGALLGAGFLPSAGDVDLGRLWEGMFKPLLASPVLAIAGTLALYPLARVLRRRLGLEDNACVCVGREPAPAPAAGGAALEAYPAPALSVGEAPACARRYAGRVVGLEVGRAVDTLHYMSSGAVSFARGVNDTPKIAAMLLIAGSLGPHLGVTLVAVLIGIGGLISARRVAETLSHRVTAMSAGQGLIANLVTSTLVIGASRLGLPVSTTHVSAGALFGIGAVTGKARWRTITQIVLAWIVTLPLAAALGGVSFLLLSGS